MAGSNFSIIDASDGATKIHISTPINDASGNTVVGHLTMTSTAGVAVPVDPTHPLPVSALVGAQTTQVGRSTNGSAGTFDTAIPTPSSGTMRLGGAVWNTSAQTLLIYFGAKASATQTASIPLNPGDSISCTLPSGVILQDEVVVCCPSGSGQSYVVTYQ